MTEEIELPSDVASYTDEYYLEITEHLEERGIIEGTGFCTSLTLDVTADEAVTVVDYETV